MELQERIYINRKFYSNLTLLLFRFICWVKIDIEGEDVLSTINLEKENHIIISNHISYLDTIVLMNLFPKIKNTKKCDFIGVHAILNWPLVGYVFKNLGMIPIKFEKTDNDKINKYSKESVERLHTLCINSLKNGNSICLFPEGRCNKNPLIMNQIRGGAYKYHKETNTRILLIGMKNNNIIWPYDGYPSGSGIIKVKIFPNKYSFSNIEDYRFQIKNTIENWLKK